MAVSARALRAGKAVIELSLLTKPVERGLRELQARVGHIGRSFTRLGTFGAFGGTGGFAGLRNLFVGSAATAGLLWPVKLAANIELSSKQMGVFTGSTEIARDKILELQEFSAVAFQDVERLTTQMRLLMTRRAPVDEAMQDIKALSVLAAGSADEFEQLTKAYADVRSAGRLQGEEMRQFKNTAWNPFVEIAKRTGETMDQVKLRMESGAVSFDEVRHALHASVQEGGLFHGMLESISGSLIGQLRKAFTQLKIALIPLGDEVLPGITKLFNALNGMMPVIGRFLKENAALYKWVLLVLGGAASLAVVFTALGLSITLVTIAAGGLAVGAGILVAIFTTLVSLPGLIVIGFAGLITSFLTTSRVGQQMVRNLSRWFGELKTIALDTFGAIADALTGGDIQLAAQVLWTGLGVTFLQGAYKLRKIWVDLKYSFIQTTVDMLLDAAEAWAYFVNQVENLFHKLKKNVVDIAFDIGAFFEKVGKSPAEQAAIDKLNEIAKGGNRATTVKLDTSFTEGLRKLLPPAIQTMQEGELKELAAELKIAKTALKLLSDKAKKTAQQDPKDWFGKQLGAIAGAGITAAEGRFGGQSFFDTRLARQMAGGGDPVFAQQLVVQKKIEANTRRRGGIPVV